MARIRTIKPSFFSSLTNADLEIPTRLTFIGLWTFVDDVGRGVDDARLVKAELWPLDDGYTVKRVERDLQILADKGKIQRYEVDGRRYLRIVNWSEHQRVNRPQPSKIPGPSPNDHCAITEGSLIDPTPDTDRSPREGKGIRKGREGNPPTPLRGGRRHLPNEPVDPTPSVEATRALIDQYEHTRTPPPARPPTIANLGRQAESA